MREGVVEEKTCTRCGEAKPFEMFNRHSRGKFGRASWCKVCHRTAAKTWYESNRDEIAIRDRAARYGLSPVVVRRLLASGCDICGSAEEALHIDHEHNSGRVRGVLCKRCNVGLGMFRDNPELLRSAADYVGSGVDHRESDH